MTTRDYVDLRGRWDIAFDPENVGKAQGWARGAFPVDAIGIGVPSVWNLVRPGYEGVAFYRRRFRLPREWRGRQVRLTVGAANYYAEFWVNGRYVGGHEGGYTPFALDVGALLDYGAENELVARVLDPPMEGEIDGFRLAEVACSKETWYYRYGGLWGDISLEASGDVRYADVFVRPDRYGRPAIAVRATLANEGQVPTPIAVSMLVVDDHEVQLAQVERSLVLDPGTAEIDVPIDLPGAAAWSPDQPRLYHCRCVVHQHDAKTLLDAWSVRFGLRTFDVSDGVFLLNGAPIILKGVLYQPNYPATLAYPPSAEMVERELRLIKDAGFNLIRFHIRPPHPAYLDLADRLGLLVYEETALAWIAPGPHLRERCRRELRETLLRDRNHPSVVLWGVFNENQSAAKAAGAELLGYARELDPTRPAIDNSGGTAAVLQDGAWSDSTHVFPVAAGQPVALNDLHLYFGVPVAPEAARWLRNAGIGHHTGNLTAFGYATPQIVRALYPRLPGGPLFVSEMGYGGLPDFAAVAAAFGEDSPLVDAADFRAYRDSLAAGVAARGLDVSFGGVEGVIAASQELQARGNVRQVDALRSNPRVSGYIITQFNDAAWECLAGIVDPWRRPKLALAALAEANRPRRLIVTPARHTATPGEQVSCEVAVVCEDGTPVRVATLGIEIDRGSGAAVRCALPLREPIARARVASPPLPNQKGIYTLRATLWQRGAELLQTRETIVVLPGVDRLTLGAEIQAHAALAEPDVRFQGMFGDLPIGTRSGRSVLLASRPAALSIADWNDLARWVKAGGRALIGPLDQRTARRLSQARVLGVEVSAIGSIGCFMGWFHYVKRGPLFRDLPADCLAGEPYALTVPHYSLNELGGTVHAGVFTISGRDAEGKPGIGWWADVQSVALGDGLLLFCQYRVFDRLGDDPVAILMLRNMLYALTAGEVC